MDNKKMFGAMAVMVLVVVGYYFYLVKYLYPHHPEWDLSGQHNQPVATGTNTPSINPEPGSQGVSSTIPSMGAATKPTDINIVGTDVAPADQTIGSVKPKDPRYALAAKIVAREAALDSVTINAAKSVNADIHPDELYSFQQPYNQQDDLRPMATRSISINGQVYDSSNRIWKLEGSSQNSATYGLDIISGNNQPLLHVTKIYQIDTTTPANRNNTSGGYEMGVTYHVENLVSSPQSVRFAFAGPTMPPREIERSDDRQVIVAYDKGDSTVDVVRYSLSDFTTKEGGNLKDLSVSSKGYKFLWGGSSSVYFGAIVRPLNAGQIEKFTAHALNPQDSSEDRQIVLDFETAELKLQGNQTGDIPLKFFCGAKERSMLEGDYYAAFPRDYNELLASSSFCGICSVSWLVDRLVDLLAVFHWALRDWGLAIIVLVIIVRLCLHPITKSSQVSMLKMQKMGPELERLKKKYGDDKEGYAKAQMELYKGMGITPVLGCLPMFLQMPIWIALYSALQNEIRLRQEPFLWGWTWIHDLARPDRLVAWDAHAFTIPLVGLRIASLNVLPILMGAVFFLQQKYTPKPPAATPEQESQQKMMQWMTLLFPLFLYPAPSGLNLYILTSTGIGVLESKRIRDHIKQKQEAETAGKIIIDAKPTRQGKLSQKQESKAPEKAGLLAGLWANMQKRVEQLRDEAERKKKK
jgi:YidC/Oxa1 family membrane protein insertase